CRRKAAVRTRGAAARSLQHLGGRHMRRLALLFCLLALPVAAAENLVSGLSQDTIEIRSNYNGAEITVFGAVERPVSDARPDIVVIVRGPETDMRVRRKDRVA